MQLTEITFENARPIDGYGPGFFRVGGQVIQGSVLVRAESVIGWGGFDDLDTLLVAGDIDILLVGTGAEISHLPVTFREALEAAGIGAEPMASPAACRTYNVLLAEGRRVGAALIAL